MNVISVAQEYIDKIVNEPKIKGMKALILDPDTVSVLIGCHHTYIVVNISLSPHCCSEIYRQYGVHTIPDLGKGR